MSNLIQSTTQLAMHIARPYIMPGATVIDATCGNGHDTLALAQALFASNTAKVDVIKVDTTKVDATKVDTAKADTVGMLYAFDVQQQAVDATRKLLEAEGFGKYLETPAGSDTDRDHAGRIRLICDSHENMDQHLDRADVIVFNLGYLPGGDKALTTEAESTMTAVRDALLLLEKGGVLCITMYSGHSAGAEEKSQLLELAARLDPKQWHAAYVNMINQANNPPEILLITRKV